MNLLRQSLVHFLVTFSFFNNPNFFTFPSLDLIRSNSLPKLHRLSKLKCLLTVSSSMIWLILCLFLTYNFIQPTVWVVWLHSSQKTEGLWISDFSAGVSTASLSAEALFLDAKNFCLLKSFLFMVEGLTLQAFWAGIWAEIVSLVSRENKNVSRHYYFIFCDSVSHYI